MVHGIQTGWKSFRSIVDRRLGLLLQLSFVLLATGLVVPAITIRNFVFSRDFSLLDSIFAFFEAGHYFLFTVTFLFSVAFPLTKIGICLILWWRRDRAGERMWRLASALSVASKWSMLDVFVIALVVLVADGSLISSADIRAGTILFSVAVLLSMFASYRLSTVLANSMHGGIVMAPQPAGLVDYRPPLLGISKADAEVVRIGRGAQDLSHFCFSNVALPPRKPRYT